MLKFRKENLYRSYWKGIRHSLTKISHRMCLYLVISSWRFVQSEPGCWTGKTPSNHSSSASASVRHWVLPELAWLHESIWALLSMAPRNISSSGTEGPVLRWGLHSQTMPTGQGAIGSHPNLCTFLIWSISISPQLALVA